MKRISYLMLGIFYLVSVSLFTACKDDDDPDPDVLSSFTYTVDATDYKKVTFTNASQNFSALSWNFGDNSALSTETNPVHSYATTGAYTVTLTATSLNGSNDDVFSTVVTISDPNAELTKLVGDVSKTWKLIRDVSTGDFPLQVGPYDRSAIWWSYGGAEDIANRPCMLNDEWTFGRDGSLVYDAKGDYWAEGDLFMDGSNNICASTSDPMLGKDGEDLSPWGGGNFTFELTTGTEPTLKAIGNGAFIGFFKSGTEYEVTKLTPKVQNEIVYDVVKLTDGDVDTLIVEANYRFELGDPAYGGYWRYVLVHYDNPANEPPIPGPAAAARFNVSVDGLTVTVTNTSEFGGTYLWEFGDGNTSASTDATHTYAEGGAYSIKLTATNPNGSSTATKEVFVSASALTDADLQAGAWHVRNAALSVVVGPGIGDGSWWQVPANFLDGSSTGGDDWSCMINDEFIFSAGGVYQYKTNGDARNDGYMGSPNGCISDAQVAASGNGAAFGSATHSYTFTPAAGSDRAKIVLTNGASGAAFIGFYTGYYGGENSNGANAPNGGSLTNQYEVVGYGKSATKEYLYVSVDISSTHDGSSSWSIVLER